jgi:ABC-type transport system involved in multi-copper enzyme maturation permease subunit
MTAAFISYHHFKKILKNQLRVILVLMFFAFLIEMLIALILSTSVLRSYVEGYFSLMPPAFKQLTGFMGQNFVGNQFIAFGYGHPAILFILIFTPVSIASRYITAEIENRSIEILALRLNPRYKIVLTQYMFIVFMVFMIFLAMFLGSLSGKYFTSLSSEIDEGLILQIMAIGLLFFSAIGAMVTFIASLFSEKGLSFSWNIGVILFLFVYDALIRLWDQAHFLKPYSLFNWYQPVSISTENYDFGTGIALLLGLIIFFILLAVYTFNRRDL